MAIKNGTGLILEVSTDGGTNYYPTAFATSCSLSVNMDTRDTTTKESAGWSEKLEAVKSWSVEAEGLQDFGDSATDQNFDDLFAKLIARDSVKISFTTGATGEYQYRGDAFITSLSMDAPMEDNVTYSISLEGTGALTESDV